MDNHGQRALPARWARVRLFRGALGACALLCMLGAAVSALGLGLASSWICSPPEALAVGTGALLVGALVLGRGHAGSGCEPCGVPHRKVDTSGAAQPGADATTAIACELSVFTPQERAAHLALGRELFARLSTVDEHADGYGLVFDDTPELRRSIAHWMAGEQRCCPFLRFELRDGERQLVLRISGPPEAKAIVRAALDDLRDSRTDAASRNRQRGIEHARSS